MKSEKKLWTKNNECNILEAIRVHEIWIRQDQEKYEMYIGMKKVWTFWK